MVIKKVLISGLLLLLLYGNCIADSSAPSANITLNSTTTTSTATPVETTKPTLTTVDTVKVQNAGEKKLNSLFLIL